MGKSCSTTDSASPWLALLLIACAIAALRRRRRGVMLGA